jgi:SWIM zinc finger
MAEPILADNRHTTTTREAIQQRTTRGMLTYNTGKVHHLEGELWAVPSTRGGWHKVSLAEESCDCEDFTFYGAAAGVGCRHVYAAAIANGTRRSSIKVQTISVAGDGFHAAGRSQRRGCSLCFGGYITMTYEEDGQEVIETVPCKRCTQERR